MAHMHYKGTGKMYSFRGLVLNGGQEKIRIQGSVGAIAWRINKLEIQTHNPGTENFESIVKIYREEQTVIDGIVNFNDDELLAVAVATGAASAYLYPTGTSIIFDNTLFVRNIWVTHKNVIAPNPACNYYIELEEVKVSAAGMAQLAVAAARRREER